MKTIELKQNWISLEEFETEEMYHMKRLTYGISVVEIEKEGMKIYYIFVPEKGFHEITFAEKELLEYLFS